MENPEGLACTFMVTDTSRDASAYGSGARTTPRRMLNAVALAPIATANVATTTNEKSGVLRTDRAA